MSTFITVIHCVTCFLIVVVVLLQSGKGAEISASFGGSSQTVFGASGGANFFVKFTQVMAVIFFTTSIALTIMGNQSRKSLFEASGMTSTSAPAAAAPAKPATPPAAAAPAESKK